MDKMIRPDTALSHRLSRMADHLLSFPGIDPQYLVRIRTYWLLAAGALFFVACLTLLVWLLGAPTLVRYGIVLMAGYSLVLVIIATSRREVLWIGLAGQIFSVVVTFGAIIRMGGLFQSGGIVTTAIAAVLFSVFFQRALWTNILFVLFCVLLVVSAILQPHLPYGGELTPFANVLMYVINTLWITGFMVFFVLTFIRERLLFEEKESMRLKELDSAKTQFYTNISHEFRTPLTIISGMAEQIGAHPERWFREGLDMIRHNSRRILLLVNQMLELSKLNAGQMPLHKVQGDVIPFLQYLTDSFRSYAESRNLTLRFESRAEELVMDYDPGKITDILSNLLSNAIKFTPDGGAITVRAEVGMEQQMLVLRVRDTGTGILPEHLPHIFDRFFRGENGEDITGSGIGLSLTQELVRLLGGDISASSMVGAGSEFTVRLPVTCLAPRADALSAKGDHIPAAYMPNSGQLLSDADDAPEKPLLLAVDDYPDILQFLKASLAGQYRIETASNGQEGVEKALQLVPDLIISDVMMPLMDGMELCRTLKQDLRSSHIPIILLTARADTDSRLEGLENRADAYLTKPFSQPELTIIIHNLLANRSALRAHYLVAAGLGRPENAEAAEMEPPKLEDAFIKNVRQFILDRLDDTDLHIDDLCRAFFMSHAQLHRKMTALTGMPPNRFIRKVRLHEAARLLHDPAKSITEVAFDTGFQDPEYFSRAFRKTFGMPPSDYREQAKGHAAH
jgi:signal transduction histidine kinase/CheY-like chemotaxis protein